MLQQEAIQARQKKILDLIETPHTIRSIADELGVSYHTVRNDIVLLLKNDQARTATTRSPTGKMMFVAGGSRPMPVIHIGRAKATLQEMAVLVGEDPNLTGLKEALHAIYHVSLLLMDAAGGAVAAGPMQLSEYKKALASARVRLNRAVDFADQMLANPKLWDGEKLLSIQEDEQYDPAAITEAVVNYNRFMQAQKISAVASSAIETHSTTNEGTDDEAQDPG